MSRAEASDVAAPGRLLVALCGATTACFVANLYYAQPLVVQIARDLAMTPALAGSVVSASQFGYGLGLLMIVPLGDTIETRRLVLTCSAAVVAGLIGLASARNAMMFLACGFLTGIFSSGAQVLLPYLSTILPARTKGRVLGYVMAGVLTAVMLARPLALFVTAAFGWRALYAGAAIVSAVLSLALARGMPPHQPHAAMGYAATLRSMVRVYAADRPVRRRTVYQLLIFAAFTMFWATVPIVLAQRFGLGTAAIGLFALVGAGGALTAPIAGRVADRGRSHVGMCIATALIAASFLLSIWAVQQRHLVMLAIAAILIDGAVQASQTFSRLIVLEVDPAVRARVNALYMTIIYTCGACGSIAGVLLYTAAGWGGVALLGATFATLTLIAVLTERRPVRAAAALS